MNEIEYNRKLIATKWINIISDNYDEIKNGFIRSCVKEHTQFDEDIFQSTIVKCHNSILQRGLNDLTIQGMKNYLFRSFKMNLKREKLYNRIKNRDNNVTSDEMIRTIDNKEDSLDLTNKIESQLFNDYAAREIIEHIMNKFDSVTSYCFKIKWLIPNTTYKKLYEITKVKDCKKRCITVMNYLKQNIKKSDLKAKFEQNMFN